MRDMRSTMAKPASRVAYALASSGLIGLIGLFASFLLSASPSRADSALSGARQEAPGWAAVPFPKPAGAHGLPLTGVSCSKAADCWISGTIDNDPASPVLARFTAGRWVLARVPGLTAGTNFGMDAVGCLSNANCWAIGGQFNPQSATSRLWIFHGTGSVWKRVTFPDFPPHGANKEISALRCRTPNDCWAVGYTQLLSGNQFRPLAIHYDGRSWTVVRTPNPAPGEFYLSDVACASSQECWFVGADWHLLHLSHGTWSVVAVTRSAYWLHGITCTDRSNCWAVGSTVNDALESKPPLILHYDGHAWTVAFSEPNASEGSGAAALLSVSCVSRRSCFAVGGDGPPNQALIAHYDGRSWSVASTSAHATLNAVTCLRSGSCLTVGEAGASTDVQPSAPLVMSYGH